MRGRLLDEPLDIARGAHVSDARLGAPAALPHLVRDRLELDLRPGEERDVRAGLGEGERRGPSDPTPGAGHDRVPAVEPLGGKHRSGDGRHDSISRLKLRQRNVRAVPPVDQLVRLRLGELQEPAPRLDAELAPVDVLLQYLGSGEAGAKATLERVVDVGVDVEAGHVSDRERAEERQPEAERRPHDLVDLLGAGDAVLDDPRRLPEHRELDPVGDESRPVPDDDRRLAEPGERLDHDVDDPLVGRRGADDLDAGDEQRGDEPVDAEEAARALEPRRELRDRDGRRVRRDHGVAGSGLDLRIDGELHVGTLEDGFDDEIGAVHGVRDRRRCREVSLRRRRRATADVSRLLQPGEELDGAVPRRFGQLGRGVDEHGRDAARGEHVRDADAHRPGADDGDPGRPGAPGTRSQ